MLFTILLVAVVLLLATFIVGEKKRIYRATMTTALAEHRARLFKEHSLTLAVTADESKLVTHYHTHVEPIPVKTADGHTYHVPWLGFIIREETEYVGGEYVTLNVSKINNKNMCAELMEVNTGLFVQGWLVANGVYAITDNVVSFIEGE